jgi:hypothetical protein
VIAFIIGVLLRYGSKGNNRVMASGDQDSETNLRCQSNDHRLDQLVSQGQLADVCGDGHLPCGVRGDYAGYFL